MKENRVCNEKCFDCVYDDCIYDEGIDPKKARKRETQRRYYEKHKEKMQAYKRQWYEEHKEHVRQQKREWYERNKQKKLEYGRKHYQENKELKNKRVVSLRRQKALDAIQMDKAAAIEEIEQFMDKIRLRYRTRKALIILLEEVKKDDKRKRK